MKWKTLLPLFLCVVRDRNGLSGVVVVLCWFCISAFNIEFASADDKIISEPNPVSWQQDAELTSVYFLTPEIGWAVGAQGVILRTNNGGRDWKEVGEAPAGPKSEMGLQQKFQAIQTGRRTEATGIADGSSNRDRMIRCRFESVFFVDEKNGWVAGGFEVPYLDHSRGVILKTADGGVTWRRIEGAFIPRLKRIHFSNQKNGWAIGDRGNLIAKSIFHTNDGGESWNEGPPTSMKTNDLRSIECDLLDADQSDQRWVVVNRAGEPLMLRGDGLQRVPVKSATANQADLSVTSSTKSNPGRFSSVRMLDSMNGWGVGMKGGVWRTSDGGSSWEELADRSSTLSQQLRVFDFTAIAISPGQIWFGGSPGTQIFSIDRANGAIQSYSTGSSLPITSMHFVDDQNGWVVGSLGMILATRDGGKTWTRQRGQHRSVAMLGVAVKPEEMPLEVLAQFSCENENLIATAVFQEAVSPVALQAVERLGGTAMYAVGTGSDSMTEPDWEVQRLERLVRLIRILRPQVLICNAETQSWPQGRGGDRFEPNLLLNQAVNAAANREFFPEQISIGYLEPWTVPRVAFRFPGGTMNLDPQKMLIQSGSHLIDRIAISRALIGMPLTTVDRVSYRIESQGNVLHVSDMDLFKGVPGTAPRRPANNLNRLNRVALESANQKQKKLIEYSKLDGKTDQDLLVWGQQIEQWISAQDEMLAGISLSQLAEQYFNQGKFELAARTLELLAHRLIGHPLEPSAQIWLARYYASDESNLLAWNLSRELEKDLNKALNTAGIRPGSKNIQVGRSASKAQWAQQDGQAVMVWVPVSDELEIPKPRMEKSSLSVLGMPDSSAEPAVDSEQPDRPGEAATVVNAGSPSEADLRQQFLSQRWQRASRFMVAIGGRDPDYVHHPQYRWLEARLTQKLKGTGVAESTLKKMAISSDNRHGLKTAAFRELQLNEGKLTIDRANPISSGVHCRHSADRPILDGEFDDPIWQRVIELGLSVEQRTAVDLSSASLKSDRIMFAHDDEYLYVALTCQKLPGHLYPPSNQARLRDADLKLRDRVIFSLDVDRDYQSAFQFSVDCRGWCRDELNDSPGWNPKWFIAQSESENQWSVELAIPLKEIGVEEIGVEEIGVEEIGREVAETRTTEQKSDVSGTREKPSAKKAAWAIRMERKGLGETNLWPTGHTDSIHGKPEKVVEDRTIFPQNRIGKQGLYQNLVAAPNEFQLFIWN